jgi:hypothetical protein
VENVLRDDSPYLPMCSCRTVLVWSFVTEAMFARLLRDGASVFEGVLSGVKNVEMEVGYCKYFIVVCGHMSLWIG